MNLGGLARRSGRISVSLSAALALAAASSGVGAQAAQAYSNSYCGVLIYESHWCGDGSNHSYDYNRAAYYGNGNVWVCERLLWADTSIVRSGEGCSYNYVAHNYGTTVALFEAEVTHKFSGGARHTIWGYAVA